MKTLFNVNEYYRRKEDHYLFTIPLIYTGGKMAVRTKGIRRAVPPNKAKEVIDRAYAQCILWVWRKRK